MADKQYTPEELEIQEAILLLQQEDSPVQIDILDDTYVVLREELFLNFIKEINSYRRTYDPQAEVILLKDESYEDNNEDNK
jgi:hypothetical protein